jgi:hypothetical protein
VKSVIAIEHRCSTRALSDGDAGRAQRILADHVALADHIDHPAVL